jgi:hypothetical protein
MQSRGRLIRPIPGMTQECDENGVLGYLFDHISRKGHAGKSRCIVGEYRNGNGVGNIGVITNHCVIGKSFLEI